MLSEFGILLVDIEAARIFASKSGRASGLSAGCVSGHVTFHLEYPFEFLATPFDGTLEPGRQVHVDFMLLD